MENKPVIENVLKKYLLMTIKRLTFGYEIKASDLYRMIGRCKFPSTTLDVNTIDNIADRVKRSMKIMMLDDKNVKETNPDPYNKPKKYDDRMNAFQIELYNLMARILGGEEIMKIYPKEILNHIYEIEDLPSGDISVLQKVPTVVFLNERNGLTFFELILLSSISLSCKRLESPKDLTEEEFREYSLRFFKKIKDGFSSPALYMSWVEQFIDVFEELVKKDCDNVRTPFIRKYLLSSKYQNRKNVDTALETFDARLAEGKEINDNNSWEEDYYFLIQSKLLHEHIFLLRSLAIAEALFKGLEIKETSRKEFFLDNSNHTYNSEDFVALEISKLEKDVSLELVHTIKRYIDNSITMTKEMLLSLSESCVVTTNTIQEFFEII